MLLFVTGSTGFIGSHFLRVALAAGHEVVALRFPGTNPVIPMPESDRLIWIDGDLTSFFNNFSTFHFPPSTFSSSALVHLAAYGVSPQPCTWEKAFQINVLDSILLLDRAISAGVKRIVISGSCMEYGRSAERYENIPPNAPLEPTGPYAASKAALSVAASALCREKAVELVILRLFTVFGEGQNPNNFWPSMRRAALAGDDFPMSPGEQISDFVPVESVAQAFLKAVEIRYEGERCDSAKASESETRPAISHLPPPGPSLCNPPLATGHPSPLVANIGTGRPQTIRSFAEHWWNAWGATGKLLPGAIPYRPNEVMRYVPEVSDAVKSWISASNDNL